jgi:hypothetical protein
MESWGYENRGVYRANTRGDDNSFSRRSDFPELPNRATFRRRLRLWSRRMEREALSKLHGPAISTRVLTVTASTRRRQLCVLLRGATWSVIPGSESFFGTGGNLLLPLLIWVALLVLSAGPWIALYNRFLPQATVAAIITLSLPPFSLVTVAHPLISVGQWFPGTRWFGLCLPLLLILAYP